jgi:hypothetical protein
MGALEPYLPIIIQKPCVLSAVCEIIVEALNVWQISHTNSNGNPDKTPFLQLPRKSGPVAAARRSARIYSCAPASTAEEQRTN